MSEKKKSSDFQSVLLEGDMLAVEPDGVEIQLSPSVAHALREMIEGAINLQREVDKLAPEDRDVFPLEMARGVLQGAGWFKAMSSAPPTITLQHVLQQALQPHRKENDEC